ncbi:MAG: adenine phosphoribosyltransferase [Actinobacteria bacterium]|nr:adenine phosphoribosyltransferase [Actinomycetota bacterium]
MPADADYIERFIRPIPDWPVEGVVFRDITPLLNDPKAFGMTIDGIVAEVGDASISRVLGVEARGFIFAAPVAHALGAGFVPVRKPGKLPWEMEQEAYTLEYGTNSLEIHADAIRQGETVLIVDDVLATGGTAGATIRLVERLGGRVHALAFVLELEALGGRQRLDGYDVSSLVTYA